MSRTPTEWLRSARLYAGTSYEEFTPTTAGDARISLSGTAYELTVLPSTAAGLTHDPVTFEPNDTPSTYAPGTVGVAITSERSSNADTADYYGFEVEQGAMYEFSITNAGTYNRALTMQRGPETVTLLSEAQFYAGTRSEPFTVPFTGRLLVAIVKFGAITGSATGQKYTLKVSKL